MSVFATLTFGVARH